MNKPRFTFRLNLQIEDHCKAWEALSAVPEGQRNRFLVQAILTSIRQNALEDCLRRVIREELKSVPSQPETHQQEVIPQEILGFLSSMLDSE